MLTVTLRAMTLRFLDDESGATAIEYALIAGIVSVCIAAALLQISGSLQGTFNGLSTQINASSR
ncbi:MAG TPA: Flp family type IVb pilin [Hyphomicrobium sp.]|nr:Flp family type IVb pilin [Hyphomicrobium sp.]